MDQKYQESIMIKELVEEHEALRLAYLAALKQNPRSCSVNLPFDPRYRPFERTSPTPDERIMINWRSQLAAVIHRLKGHFALHLKEYRLQDFPLVQWPLLRSEGSAWVLEALHAHIVELGLEMELPGNLDASRGVAAEARTGDSQVEATQGVTQEESYGVRLRRTRLSRCQTQEAVAAIIERDVSTVSRIERNPNYKPHPDLRERLLKYLAHP
jgi:hypothetical protein